MKRLLLVITLAALLFAPGCKKDDSEKIVLTVINTSNNLTTFSIKSNQVISYESSEYFLRNNGYLSITAGDDNTIEATINNPDPFSIYYMKNDGLKHSVIVKKQSASYTETF